MIKITNEYLSKYLTERLMDLSEKDIQFSILRPRRLTYFEIELMKKYENAIIKKIKEES